MSWHGIAVIAVLALAVGAGSVYADESAHGALTFEYIGNSSFKITDGKITLVTDFPYRNGAEGAMTYDPDAVELKGDVLCLITHDHFDHFDQSIFRQKSYAIIAPDHVIEVLDGYRVYPIEEHMTYKNISLEATRTRHARSVHYSYLVDWHGVRIYIAGDAELFEQLLQARDLDVVFLTPYLLDKIRKAEATIDAKKVVVYHYRESEEIVDYQNRVVPAQGDVFTIEY